MPYYSELGIYMSPTSSYTGSYLPGPYSNHSSLLPTNFMRPPPSLLKPRTFRGYKPHLATITETQSQLRRINSPKLRINTTPKVTVAKPIKINTADIDVSVNKYRKYERPKTPLKEEIEKKTEEQKEATPNKIIRRDRPTVRLKTIHTDLVPNDLVVKSWRDNFEPDELQTEEKKPKKSPGELLKEKFLIRSREDIFKAPTEQKLSRRKSVKKTPSFHDICKAITTNQIDEELNPGQPIEIQRRQSRQISEEEIFMELRRNSGDLTNEFDDINENYDPRTSVKRKKKFYKKKSNEKLILTSENDNKSQLQRRLTQKKIKRTNTDSSIGSDICDPETEKAYQEAIRDISQVEIEKIKVKPKPIITATIDVEEKPALLFIIDNVEVVESPKAKKTNKFKFNVIVEEIEQAKRQPWKNAEKNENQTGIVQLPKPKKPLISNILKKNQHIHIGHILKDIKENIKEAKEITNKIDKIIKEDNKSVTLQIDEKLGSTKKQIANKNLNLKQAKPIPENKSNSQLQIKEKPEDIKTKIELQKTENKVTGEIKQINKTKTKESPKSIKNKINDLKIEKQNQEIPAKLVDSQTENKTISLQEMKLVEEKSPTQEIKRIEEVKLPEMKSKEDTIKDLKREDNIKLGNLENKSNSIDENKTIIQPTTEEMKKNEDSNLLKTNSKGDLIKQVNQKLPKTVNKANSLEEKKITVVPKIEEIKKTENAKLPKVNSKELIVKTESNIENITIKENEALAKTENKSNSMVETKIEETKKNEDVKLPKTESSRAIIKKESNFKDNRKQVLEEIKKTKSSDHIVVSNKDIRFSKTDNLKKSNDNKLETVENDDAMKTEITCVGEKKIEAEEENFWATLGPRESIYKTPSKMHQPPQSTQVLEESNLKKHIPSKRSLVNKAIKDDPDLEVFIPPPEPELEPEPEPKPEPEDKFVPLQSNRLSQFMNPFKKPEQFNQCPVEIYATPKVIRARHYPRPRHAIQPPVNVEEESSEEESEEETSNDESSSNDEYDINVVYGNNKVGESTSSNDSGFDSGVPGSRNKDCDVNCHKKCEKLTANLCGVNQKLIVEAIESVRKGSVEIRDSSASSNPAQNPALALDSPETLEEYSKSSTFASFQKSGRITPPATTIPRFRKYCVDDFNFLKVLGKGSFGKVLLAELKNTEYYYAIKCLKKDVVLEDDDVECTLIERKVLALATKHPYLCHLLCTFQTESHLFFVMEYLNGGDLMFHIQQSGRFPEATAKFYAAEIVSGLKFLHSKGIVYRDLKLDNILLDFDGHVRIADFGMCKLQIFLDRMADTFCGTPDYMAPEIIKGQHYNQCVDWWSFGVLLYEMLLGQSPFSGCDEDELFWSICNEKPVLPRFLTAEASAILLLFLEKDANKRLGYRFCPSGDIQDQPFFKSIQWDRLEARLLEPPFKPNLQHPLDTQYFDKTFTVENAKLTPIEQNILQSIDQTQFQGFSYTNPNATDK